MKRINLLQIILICKSSFASRHINESGLDDAAVQNPGFSRQVSTGHHQAVENFTELIF